jgi:hypothetical protein
MKTRTLSVCALSLGFWLGACHSSAVSTAKPTAAAGDPRAKAAEWLRALAANDARILEVGTSFPFSFRTTNQVKECERSVPATTELRDFLDCLGKHESMLMKELGYARSLELEIVERKEASAALQPLLADLNGDETLLTTYINGDGATYSIAVVLHSAADRVRVRVLATDVEFERE